MPRPKRLRPIDSQSVADARRAALADGHLTAIVELFRALADPTRVQILNALTQQSLCVRDLSLIAGVSESAVSHQLRFLRNQRLVKPRREGNVIYYELDDQHVAAFFREADYHIDHVRRGLPDHPYERR